MPIRTLQEFNALGLAGFQRTIAGNPRVGHFIVKFPVDDMPRCAEYVQALEGAQYKVIFRAFQVPGTADNGHALMFLADKYSFSVYPGALQYLRDLTNT